MRAGDAEAGVPAGQLRDRAVGLLEEQRRSLSEVVMTSRTQTMFSFQVVPLTISRSSLLLAMVGTSVELYLAPSLLLPLAQAQRPGPP